MTRVAVERNADPRVAGDLETAVGWPRAPGELARRFTVAQGFVARLDGEVIGSATLALYRGQDDDGTLAWIGGMAVLPRAQKQGAGRALLAACLARADETGARCVGLDATPLGRPMYERAGFVVRDRTARWVEAGPPAPAPTTARHAVHPVSISEAMEIATYDLPRFGARRLPLLMGLLHDHPWQAFMTRDRATGDVSGFAFGHERGIGPVLADDEEAARSLLRACRAAGAPGMVVAPDASDVAARALAAEGYARDDGVCDRMTRGSTVPGRVASVVGVASWALG